MKQKLKYTDMAIWIDNNVYKEDCNPEILFDYLYKLFYGLSYKKNYFQHKADYDSYSIYGATCAYMRLVNPRQFLDDGDPKKIKKVKSILNFIKKIMYPAKINYQQETFSTVINDEVDGEFAKETVKNGLKNDVQNTKQDFCQVDILCYLESIIATIKNFLRDNCYYTDEIDRKNIYISCLITLLRNITLTAYEKNKLTDKYDVTKMNADDIYDKIYNEASKNAPVAFHLTPDLETYIAVICAKIKTLIAKDIRELAEVYQSDDVIMEELLSNVMKTDKEVIND